MHLREVKWLDEDEMFMSSMFTVNFCENERMKLLQNLWCPSVVFLLFCVGFVELDELGEFN